MRRAIFLTLVVTVFWLLHVVAYSVPARVFEWQVPWWPLWCLALASLFIVASLCVRRSTRGLARIFYRLMAIWLGLVFLLFSAVLIYEVIRLVAGRELPKLLLILLGGAGMLANYAVWNARRLVVRNYTLVVEGLQEALSVVHLSDVHVGTVNQIKYLKRVVGMTNNLKPDLVLMTGDLFDGSVPIHEEILRPLDNLTAPCFFSTGNHEYYEGLDHVRETIGHLKMQLLENAVATWRGVQVIGVHDRQALPKEQSLGSVLDQLSYDQKQPTIVMYHSPVEWEEARARGVDVMLSGHTHFGQIVPFNVLVRLSFKYVKGLYEEAGQYLHVTPGTGTWGPPMRLGSTNQITLLQLVPAP